MPIRHGTTIKRSVGLGERKASVSPEREAWKELNGLAGPARGRVRSIP
jgi:hypothetical protein